MLLFCLFGRKELFTTDDEYWFLISVIEFCQEYQNAEWGFVYKFSYKIDRFHNFHRFSNKYHGTGYACEFLRDFTTLVQFYICFAF